MEGGGQREETISGLQPFKGKHTEFGKMVSLVIWLPIPPVFNSNVFMHPLFHVEETVILQPFMQT